MATYYDAASFQTGQIIGIVLGILFWIFVGVLICYCCCCKNDRKTQRVTNPTKISDSSYRPALYNQRDVEAGHAYVSHGPTSDFYGAQSAQNNARLDGVPAEQTSAWNLNAGQNSAIGGVNTGNPTMQSTPGVAQPPPAYQR